MPEFVSADITDDGVLQFTCSAGHVSGVVLQQNRFEVLLEFGALALADRYLRESVFNFAAAWERFGEFYLRVVCESRGVKPDEFDAAWKFMAKQSERQLGAFTLLHVIDSASVPPHDQKMVELRNDVVHKGLIPTYAQAHQFGRQTFENVVTVGSALRAKHRESAENVRSRLIAERHLKARNLKLKAGTQLHSFLLNWEMEDHWSGITFEQALQDLNRRRDFVWASPHEGDA